MLGVARQESISATDTERGDNEIDIFDDAAAFLEHSSRRAKYARGFFIQCSYLVEPAKEMQHRGFRLLLIVHTKNPLIKFREADKP